MDSCIVVADLGSEIATATVEFAGTSSKPYQIGTEPIFML